MSDIIDRQIFVISVNLSTLYGAIPSQVQLPMNLRFSADTLVLKSVIYEFGAAGDIDDAVQIWCNVTNDNLIGAFPYNIRGSYHHNEQFSISNTFQTGNFVLQFQQTGPGNPASYNPQPLISSLAAQHTYGTVILTIEFLKHAK